MHVITFVYTKVVSLLRKLDVVMHKKTRTNMGQKSKILISFLILISSLKIQGQEINSDSISVIKIVNDFYEWYIYSNRKEDNEANRPVFVVDENEVIRLDFSKYLKNLRKFNFSDSLINRELLDYKKCEDNLKNITKEEFATFDDIFDFENIDCAFDNSYKWIGGQEMCDGIIINNVEFLDEKTCSVEIEYFSLNGVEKSSWGNKTIIILKKNKKDWKIQDIKI